MPADARAKDRFPDVTERILYLRSIPVAAVLPPPVLKVIAGQMKEDSFPAGASLMREGQPIEALHFLTSGRLALIRKGIAFGHLAPPQTLGFLGILARGDGTYDATAEEEITTFRLDAEVLTELLEDHFELLRATVRYLAERLSAEIQDLPQEQLGSRLEAEEIPPPPPNAMDLVDRMVYLRRLRAFRSTNLNSVAMMARMMIEERHPAGTRIWTAADPADANMFIVHGRVRCRAADGRTWTVGPLNALGGLESAAVRPRWYELVAETDFVGLRMPISGFEDVLEDDFALAQDFMSVFAMQLVDILEKNAAAGRSTVGALRDVSRLGAVPVGA